MNAESSHDTRDFPVTIEERPAGLFNYGPWACTHPAKKIYLRRYTFVVKSYKRIMQKHDRAFVIRRSVTRPPKRHELVPVMKVLEGVRARLAVTLGVGPMAERKLRQRDSRYQEWRDCGFPTSSSSLIRRSVSAQAPALPLPPTWATTRPPRVRASTGTRPGLASGTSAKECSIAYLPRLVQNKHKRRHIRDPHSLCRTSPSWPVLLSTAEGEEEKPETTETTKACSGGMIREARGIKIMGNEKTAGPVENRAAPQGDD
ncbi:hypothetical protein EDB87DRAFT_1578002 [Lactarius vividus]|nr:hypothetical protein EDB87DRAFT_1578002 [Lactarius vividus]